MELIHSISRAVWRDVWELYKKGLSPAQIAKESAQNVDTVTLALSYPSYPAQVGQRRRIKPRTQPAELSWDEYVRQQQASYREGIARARAERQFESDLRRVRISQNLDVPGQVPLTRREALESMAFLARHC